MTAIVDVRFFSLDVPLTEPFGIAGGAQEVARNVLVEVELADGTVGLGEAAPFPAVNGETQDQVLAALPGAADLLRGLDARRYRPACDAARDVLAPTPSALAAVETALLDALCRRSGLSLWSYFGAAEARLVTDITVPTGSVVAAERAAARAAQAGFGTLKIKVGGVDLDEDARRLRAVHAHAPQAEILLDANASLTARQALELLAAAGPARQYITLFEQPTAAADWEGLAQVERDGGVPVAADESARSSADVAALARSRAASVINVKITKTGLVDAWQIVATARAHGLGLMIGGMVETELCMSTSACLAGGIGGFRYVDLDTPLFLGPRPLAGGFAQTGPELRLDAIEAGHGVSRLR
jgi:L-alanine-DL-glutamate epimerase-like enolase superfamily enzyme